MNNPAEAGTDWRATVRCPKCRQDLPPFAFGRCGKATYGRQRWCKLCMRAYRRAWGRRNRARVREEAAARHAREIGGRTPRKYVWRGPRRRKMCDRL